MTNLFDAQTDRGRRKFDEGLACCFVCGRALGADPFFVEVGVDGFEFGTTDVTESQGGFALGTNCAKQFSTARRMEVAE